MLLPFQLLTHTPKVGTMSTLSNVTTSLSAQLQRAPLHTISGVKHWRMCSGFNRAPAASERARLPFLRRKRAILCDLPADVKVGRESRKIPCRCDGVFRLELYHGHWVYSLYPSSRLMERVRKRLAFFFHLFIPCAFWNAPQLHEPNLRSRLCVLVEFFVGAELRHAGL